MEHMCFLSLKLHNTQLDSLSSSLLSSSSLDSSSFRFSPSCLYACCNTNHQQEFFSIQNNNNALHVKDRFLHRNRKVKTLLRHPFYHKPCKPFLHLLHLKILSSFSYEQFFLSLVREPSQLSVFCSSRERYLVPALACGFVVLASRRRHRSCRQNHRSSMFQHRSPL